MTALPHTTDDLADIDALERQAAEQKTALEASRDRIKGTRSSTHAMQMAHADLLSEYDVLCQRIRYLRSLQAMAAVGATAPPPITKRKAGINDGRSLRKLGDAIPDRGLVYKAAGPRCVCASAHHRTCSYCGECMILCGHRPV